MTTDYHQTHPCPRCGKQGRRLGERPIDNATVFHYRACGKLWTSDGPVPATTSAPAGAKVATS